MKKLLFILFTTLLSLHSFAQDTAYVKVRGIPGAYNFSKSGDSLIFYVAGVRNALSVGAVVDLSPFLRKSDTASMLSNYAQKSVVATKVNISDTTAMLAPYRNKVDYVSDIPSLEDYTGNAKTIIVQDTLRGGVFIYNSSATVDNGVVFQATGEGYWIRQYDRAKGVSVDWWGDDSYAIIKAVNYAGVGGVVNFTPNKTYLQYDAIFAQEGQIFNGNGAILKRANEAPNITTLSQDAQLIDSIITVAYVPALWKVGDEVQVYQDSTAISTISYTRKILSITGNVISLSAPLGENSWGIAVGAPHYSKWAANITKVRKTFRQITTEPWPTSPYDATPTNFIIRDLILDGNKSQNKANHSWYVNSAIYARGYNSGILIEGCTFLNMPNECLVGHGFRVIKNRAFSLDGSFVHLTATYSNPGMKSQVPSFIHENFVDSVNLLPNIPFNGHGEGVITESYSAGYVSIQNNRFYHGGESVIGRFANSVGTGSISNREILMSGNYFKRFKNISDASGWWLGNTPPYSIGGHVYIDGNVFDSCGVNDWTIIRDSLNKNFDTLVVGQNILLGGTTWKLPTLRGSGLFRYVLNNQDTAAQKAKILIDNTIGSTVYSNTDATKVLSADSKGIFYLTTPPASKWVQNSYVALGGEIGDYGMTGLFDRNELTNADLRGTVTITQYTSGTPSDISSLASALFDGSGLFSAFPQTSGSSDSLKILIDLGANVLNYSAGFWQPFVTFRLANDFFKNIKVETSIDGATWTTSNTPSSWSFDNSTQTFFPTGYWMGAKDYQANLASTWRYVRFTFKNPSNTDAYVYISEIGMRHQSAPYARQYLLKAGDNIYGTINLMNKATNMGSINPLTGTFTGIFSGNSTSTSKLQTARNINGIPFDGTQNITVTDPTKLDSSYRDTLNLKYPIQYDSTSNQIKLSQSYQDSIFNAPRPVIIKSDDTAAFATLSNGTYALYEVGGVMSIYGKTSTGVETKLTLPNY